MEKSIYSSTYSLYLELLRKAREDSGLSQTELAERLGKTQSFVSKAERGERRLDIVELRAMCLAIGLDFSTFIKRVELSNDGKKRF